MSFDDSILENIKTQHESDDDGEAFMEVLGRFNEPECNFNYDPLYQGTDVEKKEFKWHCDMTQFLTPYKAEDDAKAIAPIPTVADEFVECFPTGKGPAKNVASILEAWHLIFDVSMLSQVVKSTNEEIKAIKRKESYQKRLTDMTEMRAWLGLNYLCGVLRNTLYPGAIEELWTLELGNAIFRATMTYKRFEYLGKCLRCVERLDNCQFPNPLDEVGDMWEKLVINCRSYYAPSNFCMIDEHILDLTMDAQRPFDHIIPTLCNSKGLRFITMCDAKTLYVSNAIVATQSNPLEEEIYQLISDIKGSGRCLCIRERFGSMKLMQKLRQNNLQVVGALENTNDDIPSELCNNSSGFQMWYSRQDATIICGLDKAITPTGLILTNGLSPRFDGTKLYETVKNSNGKAFERMRLYSTKNSMVKTSYSWSLELFYFMLDLTAFNAWTLYRLSENGNAEIEHRDFLRQLGLYLTQQQLKQRMHPNLKIPLPLKLQIAEILGENVDSVLATASRIAAATNKVGSITTGNAIVPDGIVLQSREIDNRRRCRGCKSRNGSKIKTRCQQCLIPYCMRHLISRCEQCSGYKLPECDADANKVIEPQSADLDASQD
ncbi:uncharacterized protein LOC133325308 [Musca vetustissima]|uniref:uncharacterized protein LOC133325308 n=1 Tax=Musca vetustissima TaxID=27455 RepID=UPI002AB7CF13|nr:uncharacterized protein LOC133325308 [Musca vetustissima]